ncbi:uncharacterized protein N7529_009352 [Penicillium soppii]|uniref:uncharacterized protein n=1 Tax=Penicillium soppii TaxID=69789 RepID=UPI0025478E41|nr:uncharacterized protein N7529_009352 [Penicillium soppii]KAJ5855408.1 hypothetical protein N7529_009352 [Penicillium soppii]
MTVTHYFASQSENVTTFATFQILNTDRSREVHCNVTNPLTTWPLNGEKDASGNVKHDGKADKLTQQRNPKRPQGKARDLGVVDSSSVVQGLRTPVRR